MLRAAGSAAIHGGDRLPERGFPGGRIAKTGMRRLWKTREKILSRGAERWFSRNLKQRRRIFLQSMSGFPFQNAILNIRVKKLKGALQSAPFFHCARRAMRNLGVGVTTREQETALGSMAKRQGKKRNGARTACEGACATKKRRGSGQKGAGRCADLGAVRQKIAN